VRIKNGAGTTIRYWTSRFTIKGNVMLSLPTLNYIDNPTNDNSGCYVTVAVKGDGTDIYLYRLENMYWTLWQ